MIVETFVLSAFSQNTRVVACEETGAAICIDPGAPSNDLVARISEKGWELKAITLTHGHLDHVGGTAALRAAFPDADVILHKDDEDLYYSLPQQPLFMGVPPEQLDALGLKYDSPPQLSRNWQHSEVYTVGSLAFEILHSPGHTRGHVVMAERSQKAVFVGDCLFDGSIGRTDLPGGDYDQLIRSINENILALGDDFTVYSGHGRETTVGREREHNPFLTGVYQLAKGKFY